MRLRPAGNQGTGAGPGKAHNEVAVFAVSGLGTGDGGHQGGWGTQAEHGHPNSETAEVAEAGRKAGAEHQGELGPVRRQPGAKVPIHHGL